jgi:hypothetical protein
MKIYVIRWASRIDGEEECGNFDVCYTDEAKARKAMLDDVKNTKADWEKDGKRVNSRTLGPDGENTDISDYAEITVEDDDTYDYHEWHIDKLDVE